MRSNECFARPARKTISQASPLAINLHGLNNPFAHNSSIVGLPLGKHKQKTRKQVVQDKQNAAESKKKADRHLYPFFLQNVSPDTDAFVMRTRNSLYWYLHWGVTALDVVSFKDLRPLKM